MHLTMSHLFSPIRIPLFAALLLAASGNAQGEENVTLSASNPLQPDGILKSWVILGPLPNPLVAKPEPGTPSRKGYETDYLQTFGGEANAKLQVGSSVEYTNADGDVTKVNAVAADADTRGKIDFRQVFGKHDYAVAYAFCRFESPVDQKMEFFLGSDDANKVWLNGELVNALWTEGRGMSRGQDRFSANVRAGTNHILVKVENAVRGWGFLLQAYDAKAFAEMQEAADRKHYGAFEIEPQTPYNSYNFKPGPLPDIQWAHPYAIKALFGDVPLQTRWFNPSIEEVTTAAEPGRYLLYIEAEQADAPPIRRAVTFYCSPGWSPWQRNGQLVLDSWPNHPFAPEVWQRAKEPVTRFTSEAISNHLANDERGSILLNALAELDQEGGPLSPLEDPVILHNEAMLRMKLKVLELENKIQGLRPPQVVTEASPTLREVESEEAAGFKTGTAEKIREICEEWATHSDGQDGPFSLLIARNGNILIHEAFGSRDDKPVTLQDRFYLASITKALTGLLFAQFVDQGLIGIDDPVGKYLPDFPTTGPKAVTLRHCFTHTSGLEGHWSLGLGGPTNPFFDNLALHQILKGEDPGTSVRYNGNSYNLAGKVMEVVSGKSIQRLFHEHFFDPLEFENAYILTQGTSSELRVIDLAKVAQMMSNRGSYGNTHFFSPETFEKLRPVELHDFYPNVKPSVEKGIGLTKRIYRDKTAQPDEDGVYPTILTDTMLGHGSATASILMVGETNGLIITAARANNGKGAYDWTSRILKVLKDGAIDPL